MVVWSRSLACNSLSRLLQWGQIAQGGVPVRILRRNLAGRAGPCVLAYFLFLTACGAGNSSPPPLMGDFSIAVSPASLSVVDGHAESGCDRRRRWAERVHGLRDRDACRTARGRDVLS